MELFSEETIIARCTRKAVGALLGLIAAATLVFSACSNSPPNILLVTLDTTRADRLGCYGYSLGHTPVIDSLAALGTLFLSAYTPVPLTLPAHATILTGIEPWEHGVRDNGFHRLDEHRPRLAGKLSEAGYRCGAIVAAYPLIRQYGLSGGFDLYDDELPSMDGGFVYPERKAPAVTDAALAALSRSDWWEPIFLWVHYFDPHTPYEALCGGLSGYDAEIALMDREIGRLLRGLPKGRWVICVVGDHGEGLGDHGEDTHGDMLYSSTMRVPLIFAGAGWPSGVARPEPATLSDLAPTLLHCAGIPAAEFPGNDLKERCAERIIRGETLHPLYRYGWPPLRSVQRGSMKLISGEIAELYDLSRDPGELHNLSSERHDSVTSLTVQLPPQVVPRKTVALSTTDRRALLALGYLDEPGAQIACRESLLVLLEEGNRYAQEGQWVDAQRTFLRVLRHDSGNLWARLGVGTCQIRRGEIESADSTFLALYQEYPDYLPVLQNLAMIRWMVGNFEGAEQFNRLVLARMPEDATALLYLAMILRHAHQYEESRRCYEKLVKIRPHDAHVQRDLGSLLAYEFKEHGAASDCWAKALEIDPLLDQREAMEREMKRWREE